MSNELFTSMRNQLMPSDDCVNDLLAKIAALDAGQSSEQPADNVLAFEPAARSKNDENTDNEFTVVQIRKSSSMAIFMGIDAFNSTFDMDEDYFAGFLS